MKQMTLPAAMGFGKHNRVTRNSEFLARTDTFVP
jgi:hypothetical protein